MSDYSKNIYNIVSASLENKPMEVEDHFRRAMAEKLVERLDNKRSEIASNYFNNLLTRDSMRPIPWKK